MGHYSVSISSNIEIEDQFSCVPNDYIYHFPLFYGLGDGGDSLQFGNHVCLLVNEIASWKTYKSTRIYRENAPISRRSVFRFGNYEMFLNMHHGYKDNSMEIKHYHCRGELWAWAAETLLTMMNIIDPDADPY